MTMLNNGAQHAMPDGREPSRTVHARWPWDTANKMAREHGIDHAHTIAVAYAMDRSVMEAARSYWLTVAVFINLIERRIEA